MRKRILNYVGFMIILSMVLTFVSASVIMYVKTNEWMEQDVRNEAQYVRLLLEQTTDSGWEEQAGTFTTSRITILNEDGTVQYDSEEDSATMGNHKDRPEVKQAMEEGEGETVRFSETLSKKTFYYALRLDDGRLVRVAKTTDSVFQTMFSGLFLMGILLIVILAFAFLLVEKQTSKLIKPINQLDLEEPLSSVAYEELRPLLVRIDDQNHQLKQQLEELKKAEEVRKEFSANVSHELKTPLMSISGYAEIMKNNMVPPDKVPDFAGRIYEEASRLTNLVQGIMKMSSERAKDKLKADIAAQTRNLREANGSIKQFIQEDLQSLAEELREAERQISKLDEGISMPFELVDVSELAEEIGTTLLVEAEKRKIKLSVEAEKQTMVNGVRHILYEMMYNVADNAIKYNHEGGYVKVKVKKNQNQVQISIEDNGIGIKKEEQERIFERFYRVDKSHSKKTGGTGLGLSIVKHGAILHDARIEIDSEPERGTKIILILKRADVHQK